MGKIICSPHSFWKGLTATNFKDQRLKSNSPIKNLQEEFNTYLPGEKNTDGELTYK